MNKPTYIHYIMYRLFAAIFTFQQCALPLLYHTRFITAFSLAVSYQTSIAGTGEPPPIDLVLDAANRGKADAQNILDQVQVPTYDQDNNTMTVNPGGGDIHFLLQDIHGHYVDGDDNPLSSTYGDDALLDTYANDRINQLEDTHPDTIEETAQANAWRTLNDSAVGRTHPDYTNDPIFTRSDAIFSMADPTFVDNLQACAITTDSTLVSETTHIPELKTCERSPLSGLTGNCQLQQTVDTRTELAYVTLGIAESDHSDNHLQDWIEWDVNFLTGETAIRNMPWGERCFSLGGAQVCHPIQPGDGSGVISAINPLPASFCDTGGLGSFDPISTTAYLGWQFTTLQQPTCDNGMQGRYRAVKNSGVHHCNFCTKNGTTSMNYEVADSSEWTSGDNCQSMADAIDNGYCTGTVQCDGPIGNCTNFGTITICEGDTDEVALSDPPINHPNAHRFCRDINITADCSGAFIGAIPCYTDINGIEQCPQADGSNPNPCAIYEDDTSCAFVSSDPVDGAVDINGNPLVFTEVWDCGYDVDVPTFTNTLTSECPGPIRCMGAECIDLPNEINQDFGKAAAFLSGVQQMAMDMDCSGLNCEVFKGDYYECMVALFGIIDCCDDIPSVSLSDYLALVSAIGKLDDAIKGAEALELAGLDIKGAWETVSDGVDSAFEAVTSPFTSSAESLTGGVDISLGAFKQTMTNEVAGWVGDVFGDVVKDSLFSSVDIGGGALNYSLGGPGAAVGTALNWAMTAYTIYQVVVLVVTLLFQCEQEDFEVGMRKALKSCHYNGSYCDGDVFGICYEKKETYCCFSTPFARILHEQIRPQIGKPFAGPRDADCTGITLQQLSTADFNAIDLSEWVGIMYANNQLPNVTNAASEYSLQQLTGPGSAYQLDGTPARPSTDTRTQERIDSGVYTGDEIRQQATCEFWGDC